MEASTTRLEKIGTGVESNSKVQKTNHEAAGQACQNSTIETLSHSHQSE